MTDPHSESVYLSVMTRESVQIMFLITALNYLENLSDDVQNAYINSKADKKVYMTAGPEFGTNHGRPAMIIWALYVLQSSGACWHNHLASVLWQLGFSSSKADPDIGMQKSVKPNGLVYWDDILCSVDDILVLNHEPHTIMDMIAKYVTFKPGSVVLQRTILGQVYLKWPLWTETKTPPWNRCGQCPPNNKFSKPSKK